MMKKRKTTLTPTIPLARSVKTMPMMMEAASTSSKGLGRRKMTRKIGRQTMKTGCRTRWQAVEVGVSVPVKEAEEFSNTNG